MNRQLGQKVIKVYESRRNLEIELPDVSDDIQEAKENKNENYIIKANVFPENDLKRNDEISQLAEKVAIEISLLRNWNSGFSW